MNSIGSLSKTYNLQCTDVIIVPGQLEAPAVGGAGQRGPGDCNTQFGIKNDKFAKFMFKGHSCLLE